MVSNHRYVKYRGNVPDSLYHGLVWSLLIAIGIALLMRLSPK